MSIIFFFFFSSRRRHTRWPRDWSSDVCSSDLRLLVAPSHSLSSAPAAVSIRIVRPSPRSRTTFEHMSASSNVPFGPSSPPSTGIDPAEISWMSQSDIERHLALAVSPEGLGERDRLAHVGQDRPLGARGDERLSHALDPDSRPAAVPTVVGLDRLEGVDAIGADVLPVA